MLTREANAIVVSILTLLLFYNMNTLRILTTLVSALRFLSTLSLSVVTIALSYTSRTEPFGKVSEMTNEEAEKLKWLYFLAGIYISSVFGVLLPLLHMGETILIVHLIIPHVCFWIVIYAIPQRNNAYD